MSLLPPSRQDYYPSSLPSSDSADSSISIRPLIHLAPATSTRTQPLSDLRQVKPAVFSKNVASLCFTVDIAGLILSVNLPGAIALGYSIESLIGSALIDLVHPLDRQRWQQECQAVVVNFNQPEPSSFRFLRQDGSSLEQTMTAQMLEGATDQMILWIGASVQPDGAPGPQEQAVAVLRLQAEWKRLMQAIALPVRQSLPLKQVLKATATEVQRILGADRVFIYLFHPNTAGNITIEILKPGCLGIRHYPHAAAICYQKVGYSSTSTEFKQRPIESHAALSGLILFINLAQNLK